MKKIKINDILMKKIKDEINYIIIRQIILKKQTLKKDTNFYLVDCYDKFYDLLFSNILLTEEMLYKDYNISKLKFVKRQKDVR